MRRAPASTMPRPPSTLPARSSSAPRGCERASRFPNRCSISGGSNSVRPGRGPGRHRGPAAGTAQSRLHQDHRPDQRPHQQQAAVGRQSGQCQRHHPHHRRRSQSHLFLFRRRRALLHRLCRWRSRASAYPGATMPMRSAWSFRATPRRAAWATSISSTTGSTAPPAPCGQGDLRQSRPLPAARHVRPHQRRRAPAITRAGAHCLTKPSAAIRTGVVYVVVDDNKISNQAASASAQDRRLSGHPRRLDGRRDRRGERCRPRRPGRRSRPRFAPP